MQLTALRFNFRSAFGILSTSLDQARNHWLVVAGTALCRRFQEAELRVSFQYCDAQQILRRHQEEQRCQ